PVTREHAAGAVAAMGGRREPDDHQTGVRIAEPGDGPPPIVPVAEGRALLAGDLFAPLDEAGTSSAVDHLCPDLFEAVHAVRMPYSVRAGLRRRPSRWCRSPLPCGRTRRTTSRTGTAAA